MVRGGNILSSSKDFKEFWDNADSYDLERMWLPGNRKYYPFYGNTNSEYLIDPDTGEKIDAIPNLRHLEPYQRLGCEDTKAAEEYILKKRIEYSKLSNKKKLKELNQNYPLTIEEAFTSGGSNNFNDEKIYTRLFDIEGSANNYKEIFLDYVYENKDGIKTRKYPFEIIARPAKKSDPETEIILVSQEPRKDILDLDIGGIDGYNQDLTQSGNSLGAMVVVRQGDKVNLENEGIHHARYPICLYYKRPPRKEIFYDTCLKISIWYGLKKNVMASAEQDFVIDYFVKNQGLIYLAQRPRSFDAPKTEQLHKLGAKMTGYSKPLILGSVQSWVEDYVQFTNFPELLRDLLAYDEQYVGTDWDSVDALAYALMRIEDMKTRPRKSSDENIENQESLWKFDASGNAILINEYVPINENENKKEKKESSQSWKPAYDYNKEIDDDDVFSSL